jgi:hypothetical protein
MLRGILLKDLKGVKELSNDMINDSTGAEGFLN